MQAQPEPVSPAPASGVRYAHSAGPSDVGARVVLRRRLPGGALSDVLGHVESWADQIVRVRTRTGQLVEVAEGDLVAAKRVPAAPARRDVPPR